MHTRSVMFTVVVMKIILISLHKQKTYYIV